METITRAGYALALCCSMLLASCGGGTNEENAGNEMQRVAGTNLREEPESPGTTPATPGKLSEEGQPDAGKTGARVGSNEMTPGQEILENITANKELSVLTGALRQAGLVNTLNGTGPYTVFAPKNSAFEALPNDSLEDLMQSGNKQRLTDLLHNHVVAGKLTAADLTDGTTLKTTSGRQLSVTKKGNDVMVNGARVAQADVMSSNGVIHIVEGVLATKE
ncbi:fasciclin domain-containing protein [Pontibacter flavimaris]|uniref:FAS1 domain-containing protein n=1 Tax=Pontibacter flavimaris TaxID=1797110 RepID=A0A1Q5PAQ1_9BACT|nr:fasciclin domain-containing protein [Pontibacter flavimaris]OKL39329.1 hypothetical protein A3841_01795 [Pontibacter flavimaris]